MAMVAAPSSHPSAPSTLSLDQLLELSSAPWVLGSLRSAQFDLAARADSIRRTRANIDRALLILLLGGTGVGKSTLLNAIAGARIAQVSSVRPCTTATTFYTSDGAAIDRLRNIVEEDDARIDGAPASLAGKILIDPPDFDSTNAENRLKLLRLLGAADLVLVVTNRVKYRQATLVELLARFRDIKTFAFVFNGLDDPLFEPSVLEDFRQVLAEAGFPGAPVFALSARMAFEARQAGLPASADAGDFGRLEQFIQTELHERRIREIKATNLTRQGAELLGALRGALGDRAALEKQLEALEATLLPEATDRFVEAVIRRTRMALFDGNLELEALVEDDQYRQLDGLFGAFVSVVQRLRSPLRGRSTMELLALKAGEGASAKETADAEAARAAASPGTLAGAQAFVQRRLERDLKRGVRPALQQTAAAIEGAGRQAGLAEDALTGAVAPLNEPVQQALLVERISAAVEDELERHLQQQPAGNPWRGLYDSWNIVPNILLAIGVFHSVVSFFRGTADVGILLFGIVLALMACIYEFRILSRRVQAARMALRQGVLNRAGEAARAFVQTVTLPGLGRSLHQARERARLIAEGSLDLEEWAESLGPQGG